MAEPIKPTGTPRSLPLNVDPTSRWRKAADWPCWRKELPNSYTYRARAVNANGEPLKISRLRGIDSRGLIYIGETGVKDDDSSERVANLARGLSGVAPSYAHNAAKRFWDERWDAKLNAVDPSYTVEIGWDEHAEETTLAAKIETAPANQQKDQWITNSGKGLAMKVEKDMLTQYEGEHIERPPINRGRPPGLRNRDRKTKRTLAQDTTDIGP